MTAALVSALAWSLVHALWLGGLAWLLRLAVDPWLRLPEGQYAASALALFGTALGWVTLLAGALSAPSSQGVSPAASADWTTAAVLVWTAGVGLLAVKLVGGLWWWSRTVALGHEPDGQRARFARLTARAGVVGARLVVSVRVAMPCTVGFLRPVVLLPASVLTGLTPADLEAVLLHELAHVRRHDWLVGVAQTVVEILLFHVPFVAWLSRRMRQERELCADALAARWVGSAPAYARALLHLEEARGLSPLAPAAHGGSLTDRLHHLLRPRAARRASLASGAAALLATLTLAGGVAWAVSPSPSGLAPWLPPDVTRWQADIEQAAEDHDVDPNLLAIVALLESGGDPEAESPVGARGLMQVMPGTAERIASARGLDVSVLDDLFDPTTSLDLAGWYLGEQLAAFDGDVELALAAYNAGPRAVRAHLDRGAPLPDETVRYVARAAALYGDRDDAAGPRYRGWWEARRAGATTVHPLPDARLTSGFGGERDHRGVDWAAPRGTPVGAAMPGTVLQAEDLGRYGLSVIVQHGVGLVTRYHHLDTTSVQPGDRVEAGTPLGSVGSTGVSSGPHLHFEVRAFGEPVDPEGWVVGR